jgi:hypothetical protein
MEREALKGGPVRRRRLAVAAGISVLLVAGVLVVLAGRASPQPVGARFVTPTIPTRTGTT